jgi:hypothetical protein
MLVSLFLLDFIIWYVGYIYIDLIRRVYIYCVHGLYEELSIDDVNIVWNYVTLL